MSWSIQHRKKDDKYRLYSSICNEWLTDWVSRNDILVFIHYRKIIEFQQEMIKLFMTFPHGYEKKNSDCLKIHINTDGMKLYHEFMCNLDCECPDEEISKKYKELADQLLKEKP